MGVHGMSADAGFTTPNLLEAETNQALLACAARVVVVADHTKWGVRGLSKTARLDDAHVLVTDDGLSSDAQTILAKHIDRIIVAPGQRRERPGRATSDLRDVS
jgi:DeoR/GlpR family transcriptional regulator of sugar metabolism